MQQTSESLDVFATDIVPDILKDGFEISLPQKTRASDERDG